MSGSLDWLAEEESYCLTFAAGIEPVELLRRMGADTRAAAPRDAPAAAEAETWENHYGPVLRAGATGGWSFAIAGTGEEGLRPEVLRRVSAGTRALTLARDVNALGFLGYFEDGEQIVGFEVLTPQERSGREPDRFLEAMHRHGLLPPGDSGEFLAVARLAANEIGVSLEREVFERAELISATVLPLLDDPEPDAPGAADLERAAAEARRVLGDEPAARTVVELALTQKAEAAVLVGDEAPFGLLARRLRAEWYRMAVGQNDPQARHLVPDDAQRERIGRRHRAAQELRRALLAVTAESAATEAAPCGPVIELDDPAAKARWQAEGAAPGTVFTFTPRPRRGANGPRPWRPGSGRDR